MRSSLQYPIFSPISLNHSMAPSTAAFAKPFFLIFSLFALVSPVAYSLPILGSTLSPALRETKKAKGTSQMRRPKKEATSVKVGRGPKGEATSKSFCEE